MNPKGMPGIEREKIWFVGTEILREMWNNPKPGSPDRGGNQEHSGMGKRCSKGYKNREVGTEKVNINRGGLGAFLPRLIPA